MSSAAIPSSDTALQQMFQAEAVQWDGGEHFWDGKDEG